MTEQEATTEWRRGLPPGEIYDGMVDDFEVHFTVGGLTWHRRRSPEEVAGYRAARLERRYGPLPA